MGLQLAVSLRLVKNILYVSLLVLQGIDITIGHVCLYVFREKATAGIHGALGHSTFVGLFVGSRFPILFVLRSSPSAKTYTHFPPRVSWLRLSMEDPDPPADTPPVDRCLGVSTPGCRALNSQERRSTNFQTQLFSGTLFLFSLFWRPHSKWSRPQKFGSLFFSQGHGAELKRSKNASSC